MKRLTRSCDAAIPHSFTMSEEDDADAWKQMEHHMASSLIFNNDMLCGGRFKRFPSSLVCNTDANVCVVNGGCVALGSSAKIVTETNELMQHNALSDNG